MEEQKEQPGSPDEVITAQKAAREKGVRVQSVYKAIRRGALPAQRSNGTWLIRRGDLEQWRVVGHRPRGQP